jgi:hypothetical protein
MELQWLKLSRQQVLLAGEHQDRNDPSFGLTMNNDNDNGVRFTNHWV